MLPIAIVIGLLLGCWLVARSDAAAANPTHKRSGHSPGYLLAVKLNQGLAGTPMRGTGFGLVVEARRWGIQPAFIAAIAGTESSFGAQACRGNRFNAYGLASCGSSWRVPAFRSWRESYAFMARFLAERWPRARTPYDYYGYAACSSCWGRKTAGHMVELGFAPVTRWAWGAVA